MPKTEIREGTDGFWFKPFGFDYSCIFVGRPSICGGGICSGCRVARNRQFSSTRKTLSGAGPCLGLRTHSRSQDSRSPAKGIRPGRIMQKTKARDILICWPYPKSVSTPFMKIPIGWLRLCGQRWSAEEERQRDNQDGLDRLYHAKQAEMVDTFRHDETKMAALRLNCQLRTQTRREQFVGIQLVDGAQSPVVVTYKGYPLGASMITYGICGIGAATPGGCFFCQFGHMTECHFPLDCKQAQCSHLNHFVAKIMPLATETIQ